MSVVFTHAKNGVPAAFWRRLNWIAASATPSSMVSVRFLVSAPVSSIRCVP
jgi:hypothetical protein